VRRAAATLLFATSVTCTQRDPNAPVRSPTYDYGRQPIRLNSDGSVVGVDGKDPEDRADEMRSGGWYVDGEGVLRYDPKRRIGGHVDKKFEPERPEDGPRKK